MPIHTVFTEVKLAVYEPLCVRRVPLADDFPRLNPIQLGGKSCPESLRVFGRTLINIRVVGVRLGGKLRGRNELSILNQERVDGARFGRHISCLASNSMVSSSDHIRPDSAKSSQLGQRAS